MNILITGGSGFLGSHIADALSKAEQKVVIFDKTPSAFRKPNMEEIIGNINNGKQIFTATKGIDIVFHLAALADINITWDNPYTTIAVNVLGTINVLEACRLNGVKKIIFASTLYADSHTGGLYRVSKHAGEMLIKTYYDYCGLKYTILRFGTLYGTRAKDNNSIRRLLKEAFLTGKIDYYGTGREVREYIHVKDAAQICVKLLEDNYINKTLILTGYHRFRLTEILDMINEILNKKIQINYHPEDNRAHYEQVPYAYRPDTPKRIVPETYCDLGASLVEILEEINEENIHNR
jgi:UDP-glucose 4-epimerase